MLSLGHPKQLRVLNFLFRVIGWVWILGGLFFLVDFAFGRQRISSLVVAFFLVIVGVLLVTLRKVEKEDVTRYFRD